MREMQPGVSAPSPAAGRRKGRPREFNRAEALVAALKIFWKKGYEPATLPDLCGAMGINPPSLYAAFGNKAALFLEALDYYEKTYWTLPAEHLLANPDVHSAIAAFFQEAAGILLSPATPCGCMTVLAAVNIADSEKEIISQIARSRDATRRLFQDRLAQAIAAGQIPPDTDVPALACALNTFLEGMSLQARSGLFLSQLKAVAAQAVKLLPPPCDNASISAQ